MQLQLGHFQRLAHAALFMLTGLVLLLFVVLFGSRLQVNEGLRGEIQRQTRLPIALLFCNIRKRRATLARLQCQGAGDFKHMSFS